MVDNEIRMEAVNRMKKMDMLDDPIKDFLETGRVWISENQNTGWGRIAILYFLHGYAHESEVKKALAPVIKAGGIPYHVIRNNTNMGVMYSILYVTKERTEWEMDNDDLKAGCAFAYVYNNTYPDLSEFGTIGVESSVGGILRII